MYKKIQTNDKCFGFNNKKFRRLRRFRFFGRAKVYLLVRWPYLVRRICRSVAGSFPRGRGARWFPPERNQIFKQNLLHSVRNFPTHRRKKRKTDKRVFTLEERKMMLSDVHPTEARWRRWFAAGGGWVGGCKVSGNSQSFRERRKKVALTADPQA